jgi:hypothetical protein
LVVIHRPITAPPITQTTTSTEAPSTPTTIASPLRRSSPRFSATPPLPIPLGVTKESRSPSSFLSCRKAVSFVNDAANEGDWDNEDEKDNVDDEEMDFLNSADSSKSTKKATAKYRRCVARAILLPITSGTSNTQNQIEARD